MRLRDLPNLTMSSLWDCLSAMYPKHTVDTNDLRQQQVRSLKEESVHPAEIVKIMNKRASEEEEYASKRRAMATTSHAGTDSSEVAERKSEVASGGRNNVSEMTGSEVL